MKKKPTKLRVVVVPDNPDYMIHVDRSKVPPLPDFADKWVYPGLQNVGPTDFDLSKLDRALNLQDGLAIKHEPRLFIKFFNIRRVPLFNSVVVDKFGNYYVPLVYKKRGNMILEWFYISYNWRETYPWASIVRPDK